VDNYITIHIEDTEIRKYLGWIRTVGFSTVPSDLVSKMEILIKLGAIRKGQQFTNSLRTEYGFMLHLTELGQRCSYAFNEFCIPIE
jgi:hypothetical protein